MQTYALRCPDSVVQTLVTLAAQSQILALDDRNNLYVTDSGTWDDIGFRRVGPPPENDQADTRPFLLAPDGSPYRHINLRTGADVTPLLAHILLDENGMPKWPDYPMRVFL